MDNQNTCTPLSAYANYQSDTNTVGLWHMDEGTDNACNGGSNDACDSSGDTHNLNISGNPVTVGGKIGKGIEFDGTGDYLGCTDANCGGTSKLDFGADSSFSYGTWIKTTATGLKAFVIAIIII